MWVMWVYVGCCVGDILCLFGLHGIHSMYWRPFTYIYIRIHVHGGSLPSCLAMLCLCCTSAVWEQY